MAETVVGLVLSSAASSEAQAIPGLPGLWSKVPELSVVPADLGVEPSALAEQARALGFDVEEIEWERETVVADDGEPEPLTLDEIAERIESLSDEDLDALAADDRKGARALAEKEIARRLDAEPGEDA